MANALHKQQQFGLRGLSLEVLGTDACTACGSCVSICSSILALGDRIASVAECGVDTGRCYHFCPRTVPFPESAGLAGDLGYKGAVGSYLDYYIVRNVNLSADNKYQYGGVVSTLMSRALEVGIIKGAVVTRSSNGFPYPVTASTREEILKAAGSKFALSPTNMEVNRAVNNPGANLGVVGLPCQCTSLKKMQLYPGKAEKEGAISIVLGLFCTWSLTQLGWYRLLKTIGKTDVDRVDLPPPPAEVMEIFSQGARHEIPLEEVKEQIRPGCHVCLDMTAENADISIGMVEGLPGHNTVIIRTEQGKFLFQSAVDAGQLEISTLDDTRWQHLAEASISKKNRAINNAQNREEALPYYKRIIKLKERIEKQ